jgi:nickel/cobalt exporter
LTPGHGKTLVASYLIGRRSRIRDALILGVSVTATHTASVFALGIGALVIERTIGTDSVVRALGIASGALVALIAVWQMPGRIRRLNEPFRSLPAVGSASAPDDDGVCRAHEPDEGVAHHHGDGRVHAHGSGKDKHALVALGISGGIVPCPGALVVLLTAISMHRLVLGLGLLVAYSLGLATVLSILAALFVVAKQRFDRMALDGRVSRILPVVSSVVVFVLGLGIVMHSLLG